jgi:diaminopimelate epimerase
VTTARAPEAVGRTAGGIEAGGVAFVKGHGTENDFVLLPDPAGTLQITPAQVRALCDRHAGIGADGVIRVAPAPPGSDAPFDMDYRNADGSLAEMCGNGARLFARYLVDAGWAAAGTIAFRTRGGMRIAQVPAAGDVTVDMGPARLGKPSSAIVSGREIHGVAVDVGNPHLVCLTDAELAELDLSSQPAYDSTVFPDGVNIEFVTVLGPGGVQMRVHERGVGETRSCGTGTVAVAAAYLSSIGRSAGNVRVGVPGGMVRVSISDDGSSLTGPAVVVASGTIDQAFWDRHR